MNPDFNNRFNVLLAYLKDKLSAKQRHDIELEANRDPFLQEALDGFSQLTPEELENDVALLQSKLRKEKDKIRTLVPFIRIAASIALFLVLGSLTWYLINKDLNKKELAFQTRENEMLSKDKTTLNEPLKPFESAEPKAEEKELISAKDKPKENIQVVSKKASPKPIKQETVETLIVLDDETELDVAEEQNLTIAGTITEKIMDKNSESPILAETDAGVVPSAEVLALEQAPQRSTASETSNSIMPAQAPENKKIVIRGIGSQRTKKIITKLTYKNTYLTNAKPADGTEAWEKYLEEAFDAKNSSKFFIFLTLIVDEYGTIKEVICPMEFANVSCSELDTLITSGPKWLNAVNKGTPISDTVSLYIDYYRP
ncbi:MAG: hypothetical protein CVU09_00555 [Bacteroidetes bacterium HGW-Bacteroidetes-4]|jgi:hypothetical protein|nr:MAG: hypothetical protein CVU09_00555 [Bacteroidetes bacterium HGW-Bacteroidetes-4]